MKIRLARGKYLVGRAIDEARRILRILYLVSIGLVIGSSYTFAYMEGVPVVRGLIMPATVEIMPAMAYVPTKVAKEQEGAVLEVKAVPVTWERGEFSAFTAAVTETDSNPDIMASGKRVYVGAIACPSRYMFGDKIEVRGYGVFTCEDRMNARYRDKLNFDIFFESRGEALQFGRKSLEFRSL